MEGVEVPEVSKFDIEARDLSGLCRKLGYNGGVYTKSGRNHQKHPRRQNLHLWTNRPSGRPTEWSKTGYQNNPLQSVKHDLPWHRIINTKGLISQPKYHGYNRVDMETLYKQGFYAPNLDRFAEANQIAQGGETMNILERLRPDPIPAIHPMPEYLASGQRAEWYEDTKQVLQVPWMGVVTMAYTHYPTFFGELWRGLRPLCQSRAFVEAFMGLRDTVENRTAELNPTSIIETLTTMGYAPREIEAIRQVNTVFSHGNQLYVLIATIARHLLEIGDMAGKGDAAPFEGRHAPDMSVPFMLMEYHHADEPTRVVYEDVMATLQLPFVNTDYRAFARWPSYFALAWSDLRDKVGTTLHEDITRACHDRAAKLAAEELPNPGGLSSKALRRAAEADADLNEIILVCRLFQWLIPGLITNVAYFRHQLEAA